MSTPVGPALGARAGRPTRLVVVAGTATEVGKTWVGSALARLLGQQGLRVTARKTAQSFDPSEAGRTDAHRLAEATGEAPERVCPSHRWLAVPMAPPMAAEALGRPVPTMAELVAELTWDEPTADVGLVETAGGVRSPLAADGDGVALVAALNPDLVVLVAHAGLGTINDVTLATSVLDTPELVVHLNRFEPAVELHRRNRDWLADRLGLRVTTDLGALASTAAGRT